jgi:hypothetical protein
MRGEEAAQGMPDLVRIHFAPQKTVAAVARVLDERVSFRDDANAVAEEAAGIADLLGELRAIGEPVCVGREYERVTAADANVFVHTVPICQPDVRVVSKEAGQRVPDVRGGPVFGEIRNAAPAVADTARRTAEDFVVHQVPPQRTTEPEQGV